MLGRVLSGARFARRLPGFLAQTLGADDARRMVAAQLASAPAVAASGKAHGEISNLREHSLVFDWNDIAALRVKNVRTRDYMSTLTASLVSDLRLNVNAGPLALATPAVLGKALVAALMPATRAIDSTLNDLMDILGIGLGEADVRVHGVRCDGAVLVN